MRWGEMRGKKFRNIPNRCSANVMHQSKLEAARCTELQLMQKGGLIVDLQAHPQPNIPIEVNGFHICSYRPDFMYEDAETGQRITEDTKGILTDVYRIKKALLKAVHGIDVVEVRQVRGRR